MSLIYFIFLMSHGWYLEIPCHFFGLNIHDIVQSVMWLNMTVFASFFQVIVTRQMYLCVCLYASWRFSIFLIVEVVLCSMHIYSEGHLNLWFHVNMTACHFCQTTSSFIHTTWVICFHFRGHNTWASFLCKLQHRSYSAFSDIDDIFSGGFSLDWKSHWRIFPEKLIKMGVIPRWLFIQIFSHLFADRQIQ